MVELSLRLVKGVIDSINVIVLYYYFSLIYVYMISHKGAVSTINAITINTLIKIP